MAGQPLRLTCAFGHGGWLALEAQELKEDMPSLAMLVPSPFNVIVYICWEMLVYARNLSRRYFGYWPGLIFSEQQYQCGEKLSIIAYAFGPESEVRGRIASEVGMLLLPITQRPPPSSGKQWKIAVPGLDQQRPTATMQHDSCLALSRYLALRLGPIDVYLSSLSVSLRVLHACS
jgi:hypothetical protein